MEFTTAQHHYSNDIDVSMIEKVLFKSIIYRLINEMKTFQVFGAIPDLETLNEFVEFLEDCHGQRGSKVFTAAHQNMGLRRLLETFKFVKDNIHKLALDVAEQAKKGSLRRVHIVLLTIVNVGDFFAWHILCDLLEVGILGKSTEDQWTCLGPGVKNGLLKIFGQERTLTKREELQLTRIVRDLFDTSGGQSGFEALKINFPLLLNKPLSLKNVEHALCEYDKYYRSVNEAQVHPHVVGFCPINCEDVNHMKELGWPDDTTLAAALKHFWKKELSMSKEDCDKLAKLQDKWCL